MVALVLIYVSRDYLGETIYHKVIQVYDNETSALVAFANTPCYWSKVIHFSTEEELLNKAEEVYQNTINGVYDEYM